MAESQDFEKVEEYSVIGTSFDSLSNKAVIYKTEDNNYLISEDSQLVNSKLDYHRDRNNPFDELVNQFFQITGENPEEIYLDGSEIMNYRDSQMLTESMEIGNLSPVTGVRIESAANPDLYVSSDVVVSENEVLNQFPEHFNWYTLEDRNFYDTDIERDVADIMEIKEENFPKETNFEGVEINSSVINGVKTPIFVNDYSDFKVPVNPSNDQLLSKKAAQHNSKFLKEGSAVREKEFNSVMLEVIDEKDIDPSLYTEVHPIMTVRGALSEDIVTPGKSYIGFEGPDVNSGAVKISEEYFKGLSAWLNAEINYEMPNNARNDSFIDSILEDEIFDKNGDNKGSRMFQ